MENNPVIGKNIKAYREQMNLTQDALASFLGISRVSISYYENGEREIPVEHLDKLADLFGIETYDLIEENKEMNEANVAFAFRTDGFTEEDLDNIAFCKKIVKNYLKMIKLAEKND